MAFPALSTSPPLWCPGTGAFQTQNIYFLAFVICCRALAREPSQPRRHGGPHARRAHGPCEHDARPSHGCRPGDALPLPCDDEPHARDVLLPSGDVLLPAWTCHVSP